MSKTKAQLQAELKKLKSAKKKVRVSAPRSTRTPKKKSLRSDGLPSTIGSAVGSMFGGSPGAALGSAAGKLFSKITGFGDYKIRQNSVMTGTDPPAFGTMGRSTVVRHREFIQDIHGSSSFAVTSFPLNPGLFTSFPWLASVAANYEEYIVRGMVYEFKSTSADALNSTNTALGSVILATNYNALRPNFASKSEMENHEFTTSGKPSESFMHPIECAPNETPVRVLYTRTGATALGDLRMYDLGNFQLATAGMQAVAVIGELWVTYDVELLKPRLAQDSAIYYDHWRLDSAALSAGTPYGTAPALSSDSNFGSVISGGSLIMPYDSHDYQFMLVYQCSGASTTLTNAITYTSGAALGRYTCWLANTVNFISQPAGAVSTKQFYMACVSFAASAGALPEATRTITLGATGTFPGTNTGGDMWILSIRPPLSALLESIPERMGSSVAKITHSISDSKEDKKEPGENMDDEDLAAEFLRFKSMSKKSRATTIDDRLDAMAKAGPPPIVVTEPDTPKVKVASRK